MVDFLPFEGLRPNLKAGEHIGDRISPPYDVIGPDYLKELQSKPHNITRLTLNPDGTVSGRRTSVSRMWNDKMYLFPIPQTERMKNGNLSQNPGWD